MITFAEHSHIEIDRELMREGVRLTPQSAANARAKLIEKLAADDIKIILDPDPEFIESLGDVERQHKYLNEAHERIRKGALYDLKRSEIVLWNNDVFYGAINGWEAFDGHACELPEDFTTQLWLWDVPLSGTLIERRTNAPTLIIGMLVMKPRVINYNARDLPMTSENAVREMQDQRDGFAGVVFAVEYTELEVETTYNEGMTWHERLICAPVFITEVGARLEQKSAQTLAAVEFLRLPFVSQERIPAQNRAERRRLKREDRENEIAQLRVVTLRKSQASHSHSSSDEHTAREFSCHFLVRGHWRKQFLPSSGTHRPTWIEPFVKGDQSKPFKASAQVVYKAAR